MPSIFVVLTSAAILYFLHWFSYSIADQQISFTLLLYSFGGMVYYGKFNLFTRYKRKRKKLHMSWLKSHDGSNVIEFYGSIWFPMVKYNLLLITHFQSAKNAFTHRMRIYCRRFPIFKNWTSNDNIFHLKSAHNCVPTNCSNDIDANYFAVWVEIIVGVA